MKNIKMSVIKSVNGIKYDDGKNRIGLMIKAFAPVLEKIAEVMSFKNIETKSKHKYEDDNWKDVEQSRYLDAFFRHLFSHLNGDDIDNESRALHIVHACWNLLAYTFFVLKEGDNE